MIFFSPSIFPWKLKAVRSHLREGEKVGEWGKLEGCRRRGAEGTRENDRNRQDGDKSDYTNDKKKGRRTDMRQIRAIPPVGLPLVLFFLFLFAIPTLPLAAASSNTAPWFNASSLKKKRSKKKRREVVAQRDRRHTLTYGRKKK